MPFKSDSQRRFLFATDPKLAKKFAAETPNNASLPEKVKARKESLKKASGGK